MSPNANRASGLPSLGGVTERRERPSARVVVVDDEGNVLLFRIEDPLDDKPPCWITPGGGIEPGETPVQAAVRELREETGVVVAPADLGAPVAVCEGDWDFRGTPLHSVDWFFALRRPRFEPSRDGWDEIEQVIHAGWRWWSPDALDTTDDLVLPTDLAALARTITQGPPPATPTPLPWRSV
jgi:8-oxo-dGTP pyrophosphatase MutT (NUDIX family)